MQNTYIETLNTGIERKTPLEKTESLRMDCPQLPFEDPNELDNLEASLIERKKVRSLQLNKLQRNRRLMMGK